MITLISRHLVGITLLFAATLAPLLCLADPQDPKTTDATGRKFAERTPSKPVRVLLAGAGSSHDFPKYFLGMDSETLTRDGRWDVATTPNLEEALTLLPEADVLVFSGNHDQYGKAEFQKALHDFADQGKGLVFLHAATWDHSKWKGYNERFINGKTPSHGKGEFEVTVRAAKSPLMQGVPATFKIHDENYRFEPGAESKFDVSAENAPDGGKDPHPSVWIVKDAKTRIVCITLGHDEKAHGNPAFKSILVNSVRWVAGR